MNLEGLRLELADQRTRVAALEGKVARLVEIIASEAAVRAIRQEVRRVRVIDERRALIRALAGFFEAGNTEAAARAIESAWVGENAVPDGATELIVRLRRAYGNGGPSRRTVRRALTELPNGCVNGDVAENWCHS